MTTLRVATCLFIFGFCHFLQAEITKADALTQVGAHVSARMAKAVSYQYTYRFAILKKTFDSQSAGTWDKKQSSGNVLLGADRTRFKVSFQRLTEYGTNSGKVSPFGSYVEYSNDGDIFRTWSKNISGEKITVPKRDDDLVGYGVVSAASDEAQHVQQVGVFRLEAEFTGISCIPPFVPLMNEQPRTLPEMLDISKDSWTVTEDAQGWRFAIPWVQRTQDGKEIHVEYQIVYDPQKQMFLEIDCRQPGGGPETRVDLQKVNAQELNGEWWPQSLDHFQGATLRRTEFTNMTIENGDGDRNRFSLTFPDGIRVSDHVEGKKYEVGSSMSEQESVRRYKQQMGAILEPAPLQSQWVKRSKVAAALLVTLLVVGAVWRWRRGALLLLFALLPWNAMSAEEGDSGSLRFSKSGDWEVEHANNAPFSTVQCGTRVTLFALECAGIQYKLPAVVSALKPESDGIRLLNIKDVLLAYGMRVEARKGVSAEDMLKHLTPSRMAIFPAIARLNRETEVADWRHYFVAMLDKDGQPTIYDVPKVTKKADVTVLNELLKLTDGMVLFAECGNTMNEILPQWSARLDFGEFEVSGPDQYEEYKKDIEIAVPSGGRPLLIEDVQANCGCTVAAIQDRLIRPGCTGRIQVSIRAHGWGLGDVSKHVHIYTSQGAEPLKVAVRGKGMPGIHTLPAVQLTPSVHRVTYETVQKGSITLVTNLSGMPEDLSDLVARGKEEGIRGTVALKKLSANHGELNISIEPSVECLEKLKMGINQTCRLELGLKSHPERDPHVVHVHLNARKVARFDPAVIEVLQGGTSHDVSLVVSDGRKWSLAEKQTLPPGIRVGTNATSGAIAVSADANAAVGAVSLNFELQEGQDRYLSNLVVNVRPQ